MNRREPQKDHVEASQPSAFPPGTLGLPQPKDIKRLCAEIAREFHPDKIVLFGSHAYGKAGPESDVDLLVVMPFDGSPFKQAAVILDHVVHAVGVIPFDLLVRTAQQVQERIQMGDTFMRDVIERGRVMYEADHSRVD